MTEVAVISVLYQAQAAVRSWAEGLQRAWERVDAAQHHLTMIAVDNASGDGTPELLERLAPAIRVLRQPQNQGFAAGCNRGLREVPSGALVVLMNPDVVIDPTFFERLVRLDWADGLAAIGPQIQTPTGDVEQSARGFPSLKTGVFGRTTILTRWFPNAPGGRGQLLAAPERGATRVDWVSGACLIAPRVRFDQVGLFDEGYWMYWEDADWCRRANEQGLRVEYRPELLAIHYQGSSASAHPVRTTVAFHRSASYYYGRHIARSPVEGRLASVILRARMVVKLAGTLARLSAAELARRPRSEGSGACRREDATPSRPGPGAPRSSPANVRGAGDVGSAAYPRLIASSTTSGKDRRKRYVRGRGDW